LHELPLLSSESGGVLSGKTPFGTKGQWISCSFLKTKQAALKASAQPKADLLIQDTANIPA